MWEPQVTEKTHPLNVAESSQSPWSLSSLAPGRRGNIECLTCSIGALGSPCRLPWRSPRLGWERVRAEEAPGARSWMRDGVWGVEALNGDAPLMGDALGDPGSLAGRYELSAGGGCRGWGEGTLVRKRVKVVGGTWRVSESAKQSDG